jgi:predicted RNase H-like HicB family nuclease
MIVSRMQARKPPTRQTGRPRTRTTGKNLPLLVEKGKDGFYVVECPLFRGCYSQGRTIDEALANIREVIDLILEEREARGLLRGYSPEEVSLHTIRV